MTQNNNWSPISNGNNHRGGVARPHHYRQMPPPYHNSMSHRVPTSSSSSPLRHAGPGRSNAAMSSLAAAASGGGGSNFSTPTKGPRPAPQCSSNSYRQSPTSVAARLFDNRRGPQFVSGRSPHRGSYDSRSNASGSHHGQSHNNFGANSSVARCHPVNENKKYKTEMCKNMLTHGYCRFGENCHYAHSEEERHTPSVEDLTKDDRLMLPCSIMVSTGFCPYDHRCKSLHDPRVVTFPKLGSDISDNKAVVLEHCTKAKRSGDTIPDRLYHRHLNSIRQVNPLIAPYIWEARSVVAKANSTTTTDHPNYANNNLIKRDLEFQDTYNLVCNAGPGVNVFPMRSAAAATLRKRRTGGGGGGGGNGSLYSDILNKTTIDSSGVTMLCELQKLCIVLQMRAKDDTHLDFIYAPKDCMNGQPCMVLHTRFFRLLDIRCLQQPTVSVENVVAEVPPEVYHAGKCNSPNAFVCAHEVAFDSKGKRSCNLSVWFDTMITTCSSSKAKKMSKKDDPWHLDDTSGSLFCMPNNEEFEMSFLTTTAPYVFMQPVDDIKTGHELVKSILEHRVSNILLASGFCFHELPHQLGQLGQDYASLKEGLERWAWSKTSNMDHFSKTKEEQNQTLYSPSDVRPKQTGSTSAIWTSFVTNLNSSDKDSGTGPKTRLPIFRSIMEKADTATDNLPRIRRAKSQPIKNKYTSSFAIHNPTDLSEATWRELLIGEGDGSWKRTIESHTELQRKSGARPSPVTPTKTQFLYSR